MPGAIPMVWARSSLHHLMDVISAHDAREVDKRCLGAYLPAVIARIDADHPGAAAIKPTASKTGGGCEGRASNSCIHDAAVVGIVAEIGIHQHIQVSDSIASYTERNEGTNARLIWSASCLQCPLNSVVERDRLRGGYFLGTQIGRLTVGIPGNLCGYGIGAKGDSCECPGSCRKCEAEARRVPHAEPQPNLAQLASLTVQLLE